MTLGGRYRLATMSGYDAFDANRIKHLEMIQAVIGRLGNDSFLVKGWAVTVAGVFFGFAVNGSDSSLAFASLLPTVVFWGLDTYFLRSERLFRALYDRVRADESAVPAFSMAATGSDFIESLGDAADDVASWLGTFLRPTLAVFYGGIVASALAVALAICLG
jgi:hypothetical protein